MDVECNVGASTSKAAGEPMEVDSQSHPAVTASLFDIQAGFIKISPDVLIEWLKGENKFTKNAKKKCKVLKFSHDWTLEEALQEISEMCPTEFKNLFVFIITVNELHGSVTKVVSCCDETNGHGSESEENPRTALKKRRTDEKKLLQEKFIKFLRRRQIIIQLTSQDENTTKIFFNQASNMNVLEEVKRESGNEKYEEFPSFLRQFLSLQNKIRLNEKNSGSKVNSDGRKISDEQNEPCDDKEVTDGGWDADESSDEDDSPDVKKASENQGTNEEDLKLKNESAVFNMLQSPDQLTLRYLTIFDFSPEFSFRVVAYCAAKFSRAHLFAAMGMPFEDRYGEEPQVKLIKAFFKNETYKSLLQATIDNDNRMNFDYLRRNYSCLITRLPIEHQIEISNQLVAKGKFGMLCDLLESIDFPFPNNNADIKDERFLEIVDKRGKFHKAIMNAKLKEINEFLNFNKYIKSNQLEIFYNANNKSALHTALNSKNFDVLLHLKKKGLTATDIDDSIETLMCKNVEVAINVATEAVNLLAARSKIHRNEVNPNSEQLKKQNEQICSWLTAVSQTTYGGPLIRAAAQCDKLQIVFDFERKDVAGVDFDSVDADGIMYRELNLIIIASKNSTKEDEQRIKGALAHELAHYVIGMLFLNSEYPYFDKLDPRYEKFDRIVKKYSYFENEDDGCEDIISIVYRNYEPFNWHAELIVRMFHINAQFEGQENVIKHAKTQFKDLDDFTKDEIIPLMEKLNMKSRNFVNIFNKLAEFASKIRDADLQFPTSEPVKNLINRKLTIVTSNVPRLLFIEIYNHLKEIHGNLVDYINVFLTQEKLSRKDYLEIFKTIIDQNQEVNFILDFSSGNFQNIKQIGISDNRNFIIVVKDEKQSKELIEMLADEGHRPNDVKIIYEWSSLNDKLRNKLLQYKVKFQKNSNYSLFDIIGSGGDISKILSTDILNKILNSKKIEINSNIGFDEDRNFQFLFREREFVRSVNIKNKERKISQRKLLKENKGQKYVLISDVAGSGKSWAMKSLALACGSTTCWVTFVDLKLFTAFFKKPPEDVKFIDFLVNQVLQKIANTDKEIFKQKYQKGRVKVFFDGFDEIAPVCVKFVVKLIKSFESNGENQLFVSTRNFFEIELKTELNVPWTYKLQNLYEEDGMAIIATIWRLEDLRDSSVISQKDIFKSNEYDEYYFLAENIINNLSNLNESIALPQIYSMIGKITKQEKKLNENLSIYQLYLMMWNMSYQEWYSEKGQFRSDKNSKQQFLRLNSLKLHELKAMERFAPGKSEYCDIDLKDKEQWSDIELDGCGIMSKKEDGEFYFNHETFYEFFVAEFIIRNMNDSATIAEAFAFMLEAIFNEKHEVIRKLLHEGLQIETNESKDEWIELLAKSSHEKLMNGEKLCQVFADNLQNFDCLTSFLIEILKRTGTYENFTSAIANELIKRACLEQGFILADQNGSLIVSTEFFKLLAKLINSRIELEILLDIGKKINGMVAETSEFFFKQLLRSSNEIGENVFYACVELEDFKKFEKLMKHFLTKSEIAEKLKEKNKNAGTILHYIAKLEPKYDWEKSQGRSTNVFSPYFRTILNLVRLILELSGR